MAKRYVYVLGGCSFSKMSRYFLNKGLFGVSQMTGWKEIMAAGDS